MERKMMQTLIDWKESISRNPLVLFGARQVGKTNLILNFGRKYYRNIVYFNIESNGDVLKLYEKESDIHIIMEQLSQIAGEPILENETLIFFDEIRSNRNSMEFLQYLSIQAPDYHVIAAGSIADTRDPVKKGMVKAKGVVTKTLYPMDFEEFLWAVSGKEITTMIRDSYTKSEEFSLHESAMDYYRAYMVTGGMPSVVDEYKNTRDLNFVIAKHRDIHDAIIADITKYTPRVEFDKIIAVLKSIPSQLLKENKKFQYNKIKNNALSYEYEGAIEWLKSSGIITRVCKINEEKGLALSFADCSSFKAYFADVGILFTQFNAIPHTIFSEELDLNSKAVLEALVENYVANALEASGLNLCYWELAGRFRVDFVFQNEKGSMIPVDVEFFPNVLPKSVEEFARRFQSSYTITISSDNFNTSGNNHNIPLYAVFCLGE